MNPRFTALLPILAILLPIFLFLDLTAGAQDRSVVVADSLNRQPLSFATLQFKNAAKATIAGIDGKISLSTGAKGTVTISFAGYRTKTLLVEEMEDTVWLAPAKTQLQEVVVRSQQDRIRRIINTAIKNRGGHDPDKYGYYQCHIYYKMNMDMEPLLNGGWDSVYARYNRRVDSLNRDTLQQKRRRIADTTSFFSSNRHLIFSESYTRRTYRKPGQLQEQVLASRFSGLKKTYFTNVVTEVIPFHIYSDYIKLNEIDYLNPVARGWQQRYRFFLEDELEVNGDTVFLLSYEPRRGALFNALRGVVYINSSGYAVSHFIAHTGDSASDRQVKFEQIYQQVNGKWFPRELNYDFIIRGVPGPMMQIKWNGHSLVDSISFLPAATYRFDKAHPVTLHDSVDNRTSEQWARMRKDTITQRELNTYRFMDSIGQKYRFDDLLRKSSRLNLGRWPVGKLDLDLNRLVTRNGYERTRLGLGLYTNDKISGFISVGGWAGYGFGDKEWKYGFSATVFPNRNREHWLEASYQRSYRNPGEVALHPELDKSNLRNWILQQVDAFEEWRLTGETRSGYWAFRVTAARQDLSPRYVNNFQVAGKTYNQFRATEGSIGLRYAYGEKRVPVYDYFLPMPSRYPVLYARLGGGKVASGEYESSYLQALAALTWSRRTNRWGQDNFRVEGGWIHAVDDRPLPRSFLMAGNGFRMGDVSYYTMAGFLTMKPFEYYSDRYASLQYRHDFDRFLWNLRLSKPFISLAHNLIYGSLRSETKAASSGLNTFDKGYHESGLLLNQLLRWNLRFADLNLNFGGFYHWAGSFSWKNNGVFVVGAKMTF